MSVAFLENGRGGREDHRDCLLCKPTVSFQLTCDRRVFRGGNEVSPISRKGGRGRGGGEEGLPESTIRFPNGTRDFAAGSRSFGDLWDWCEVLIRAAWW